MRREAPGPAYLDLDLPEPPRTQARERKTSITPATPRGWHGFMRVTGMPAHTAATLATSGSPTGHPTTSTCVSVSAPRAQSRRTRGSTLSPHRSSHSQSPTGLGGAQSSPPALGREDLCPTVSPKSPTHPPTALPMLPGGGVSPDTPRDSSICIRGSLGGLCNTQAGGQGHRGALLPFIRTTRTRALANGQFALSQQSNGLPETTHHNAMTPVHRNTKMGSGETQLNIRGTTSD